MIRHLYQGRLLFPHGFHTGDGRRLGVADQPLRRNHAGRVELSGTSLAGVLRSELERLAQGFESCRKRPTCPCSVCWLMGPRASRVRAQGRQDPLRASRLFVSGGSAEGKPHARIRDHVGIDRRTRTAADRRKYDVEVIHGAVAFPFELRLDVVTGEEENAHRARRFLELALHRLAGGWWFLGGKSAAGPGQARLLELDHHHLDFDQTLSLVENLVGSEATDGFETEALFDGDRWQGEEPKDLVRNLTVKASSEESGTEEKEDQAASSAFPGELRLHLEIDFPFGLLVNDPGEAVISGYHHAAAEIDGDPLLPGSALRGALRSRAEQILRTFAGTRGACHLNTSEACHERIEGELAQRRLQRQKLTFEEERSRHCLACLLFGSGRLASAIKFTDFRGHRPPDGEVGEKISHDFVAIDRFTGGAAEGAKFDALASRPTTVRGSIHVNLGRLEDRWALALLALVLRDLLFGDVPLGFASARGLNEYRARVVGFDRYWLESPEDLEGLVDDTAGELRWRAPAGSPAHPSDLAEHLGEDWRKTLEQWVDEFHARMQTYTPIATDPLSNTTAQEAHP